MKLNGEQFLDHGFIDVSNLIELIKYTENDSLLWDQSDRGAMYPAQKATQTLEFIWTPNLYSDKTFYIFHNLPVLNSKFGILVQEKLKEVLNLIPGKIIKAGLVRMIPGGMIPPHIDGPHESWSSTHRVHLPIITEKEIEFFYTASKKHLEVNRLTEINNFIPHGVIHNGRNLRYHLMFDILPSDYSGDFAIKEHSDRQLYQQQRTIESRERR